MGQAPCKSHRHDPEMTYCSVESGTVLLRMPELYINWTRPTTRTELRPQEKKKKKQMIDDIAQRIVPNPPCMGIELPDGKSPEPEAF